MLDHSVSNNDISIDGFSKEIYRSDHPSNTKIGGVCLYFREGLPIKRRTDLELLPEMILCEITIARKKILFCQHQIIYGKLNVSLPSPPPYRRLSMTIQKLMFM